MLKSCLPKLLLYSELRQGKHTNWRAEGEVQRLPEGPLKDLQGLDSASWEALVLDCPTSSKTTNGNPCSRNQMIHSSRAIASHAQTMSIRLH